MVVSCVFSLCWLVVFVGLLCLCVLGVLELGAFCWLLVLGCVVFCVVCCVCFLCCFVLGFGVGFGLFLVWIVVCVVGLCLVEWLGFIGVVLVAVLCLVLG